MNLRFVFHLISWLIIFEGASVAFIVAAVAAVFGDSFREVYGFIGCGVFIMTVGGILMFLTGMPREENFKLQLRDGFLVVTLGWLIISIMGCLPFIVIEKMYFSDALFETVSGFTTTGSTVIDCNLPLWNGKILPLGIESLSYGILFWRSLTHWIGGMGIVLFSLAILPLLGTGGQALYNAEVPGVKTRADQLTPKISKTAKILWGVYAGLTIMETVLLTFDMPFFDAVCHSFSTIATGGFSTKSNSIAGYSSYVQCVIMLFMFLSGCNFVLHIRAFNGLPWKPYLTEEHRCYVKIILISTLIITGYLVFSELTDTLSEVSYHGNVLYSMRDAAFQVISVLTTTGFATADYINWPDATHTIILGLMLVGGCGGSTSGGIKCIRILLLGKFSISEIKRHVYPRAIRDVRLDGFHVDRSVLHRILAFVSLYVITIFVFTALLTFFCSDMDLLTAITASVTSLDNCGPAFGRLGPSDTYSWLTPMAKILLSLEMIIGRLELYTVLVLFSPSFWKK